MIECTADIKRVQSNQSRSRLWLLVYGAAWIGGSVWGVTHATEAVTFKIVLIALFLVVIVALAIVGEYIHAAAMRAAVTLFDDGTITACHAYYERGRFVPDASKRLNITQVIAVRRRKVIEHGLLSAVELAFPEGVVLCNSGMIGFESFRQAIESYAASQRLEAGPRKGPSLVTRIVIALILFVVLVILAFVGVFLTV